MAIPDLPSAAHADLDSMLSRKFGKEVANYFSGSPLNRFGFLRGDSTFLSSALKHPSTSFLLCNNLQPLIREKSRLEYVKHADVKAIIGEDPYAVTEEEQIQTYNSTKHVPQIIFLGLDERVKGGFTYKDVYGGAPYFAVDVTPRASVKEACETLIEELAAKGLTFAQGRAMDLEAADAAIFAEARQLLDWNLRNPYCAQCGQPTLSVNAGFKRACPPTDLSRLLPAGTTATVPQTPETDLTKRPPCATRTGVSNVSFPRTDATIIVAVVNHAGDALLLGRQKRWPAYWYSTLAGFVEPAESIEEAVRREVWEEAGIHLGRVVIHSTQPWPYPANLMVGAVGQSVPGEGEKINLGHDPELEDARWFSFDEVRTALKHGTSALGDPPAPGYKEGDLRLPPRTAIANQLITAVVENGFVSSAAKI